jgi:hypothetical protein
MPSTHSLREYGRAAAAVKHEQRAGVPISAAYLAAVRATADESAEATLALIGFAEQEEAVLSEDAEVLSRPAPTLTTTAAETPPLRAFSAQREFANSDLHSEIPGGALSPDHRGGALGVECRFPS